MILLKLHHATNVAVKTSFKEVFFFFSVSKVEGSGDASAKVQSLAFIFPGHTTWHSEHI